MITDNFSSFILNSTVMDISTFLNQRIKNVQNSLSLYNIDALLITNPFNLFYLTDYVNVDGFIIITGAKSYYMIDSRSLLEAKGKVKNLKVLELKSLSTIKELLLDLEIKKLGVEANHLTLQRFDYFEKNFREIKLVQTKNIVENFRYIKDEVEIKRIKKASKISKSVYREIIHNLSNFQTEIEISNFYESKVKAKGGDGTSFHPIIACAKNSAIPHYSTGKKIINLDSPILFDLGAKYRGYASDMTRMYIPKSKSQLLTDIYKRVSYAKKLAISHAKAGVFASDLDKLVREYFEKYDLNKYFTHSLGHGVGLEVHDGLSINAKSDFLLKTGMVLTIEPGLYLAKNFGIRLEDMILISDQENEIL